MKLRLAYTTGLLCLLFVGCDMPTNQPPKPGAGPITEPVKAEVGVGKQGRSLDNENDVQQIISMPVSQFFKAKEKIAYEIAVPHALNLFNASEGRLPKSHEEFMEKIIRFNNIQLPKLPDGAVYRFHPDDGLLYVEPDPNAATNSTPK